MPRVIHFEFAADDPERAVKFYEGVFGWKVNKWNGPVDYWLVSTGEKEQEGINGAIMKSDGHMPRTINTIDVPSVDEYTARVTEAGGKVVAPKMAIPGVGYFAYCTDTEGNMFGIMQSDPNAQ